MAKYYIQSGTFRAVVDAEDCNRAALWAVHRTMRQIVPIYDDVDLDAEQKSDLAKLEGLLVLGDKIRLSQRGFDRPDAEVIDTFTIVTEWHQLMVALARLEDLLEDVE